MKLSYVTFCTKEYIVQALTLIDSLKKCDPDSEVYFVPFDNESKAIINLKNTHQSYCSVIEIENLSEKISELIFKGRSKAEAIFALKPLVISKILDIIPKGELLFYCDADLYFFSKLQLPKTNASIFLSEHLFLEKLHNYNKFGKFNAGLVGFRNDVNGKRSVDKWRKLCEKSTSLKATESIYGDQKYLELLFKFTKKNSILKEITINQGMWGMKKGIRMQSGPKIDGQFIQCFHFHGFKISKYAIMTGIARYETHPNQKSIFRVVYKPYIAALRKNRQYGVSYLPNMPKWKIRKMNFYEYRFF